MATSTPVSDEDASDPAIKTEPCESPRLVYEQVQDEEVWSLLYADHEVKDEMVIGPTEFRGVAPDNSALIISRQSGALKRKAIQDHQKLVTETMNKTTKLTSSALSPHFESPPSSKDNERDVQEHSLIKTINNTEDLSDITQINGLQTENVLHHPEVLSEGNPIDNAKDLVDETQTNRNKGNDPGLWGKFSFSDIEYWLSCGPNDCQHAEGPFDKSRRMNMHGQHARNCTRSLFFGQKVNGKNSKRDWLLYSPSTGKLYCFVCKLFSEKTSNLITGFSDWNNSNNRLRNHEREPDHRNCLLKYLCLSNSCSLSSEQSFDEQLEKEIAYWDHTLQRVIAAICMLAERGCTVQEFKSPHNGSFLGLLELVTQFDPFLSAHITKNGYNDSENAPMLTKNIYAELIAIMAQQVRREIAAEVKDSVYYSISIDSMLNSRQTDQIGIFIRYLRNGLPKERFLSFIELKHNEKGDELAKQTIQCLVEECGLDFSKCRGQSYDNASNMSELYIEMQKIIVELNPFAMYFPSVWPLNVVARNAVDCCPSAVHFFALVQNLSNFFNASASRLQILATHVENENVLNCLSDTRLEALAQLTSAILEKYDKIIDALDAITEDDTQKGETKRGAGDFSNDLQELEFVVMLVLWNDISQSFVKASKTLDDPKATLGTCAARYKSLVNFFEKLRLDFDNVEARAKLKLPGIDFKEARQKQRRNMTFAGPTHEVSRSRSPRELFQVTSFYGVIDKLIEEMTRRALIFTDLAEKFSFLTGLPHDKKLICSKKEYINPSERLRTTFPQDVGKELVDEIQLLHFYLHTRGLNPTHAQLYKLIHERKMEAVFPNVVTVLGIYLCLMVNNCTVERAVVKSTIVNNKKLMNLPHERLDGLSVLYKEADLLRKLNFNVIVREFAVRKIRKTNSNP